MTRSTPINDTCELVACMAQMSVIPEFELLG